jgi:hypothetical protein
MIKKSLNLQIRYGLVLWTFLLAFFGQAASLPAEPIQREKIKAPATVSRPHKAKPLPRVPVKMLAETEELPEDFGKSFPAAAASACFTFHARLFQLPAGNRSYLRRRGAATPLYLRHCLLRI